jgi:hypothetical protein
MREVWHGSDPAGLEPDAASGGPVIRIQLGTPRLVGWWWALFLVSGFLGNITARMAFASNQSLDQLQALSGLLVFSDLLDVPSVLVAVRLVSRVTIWQTQRAELVSGQLPVVPPLDPLSATRSRDDVA